MGGTIQGEWKYVEPEENENDLLKDTETRDLIQKEFICLQDKFEEATRHWLDGAPDASHRRDVLTRQLRLKYYQLAPYVRARTVCIIGRVSCAMTSSFTGNIPKWTATF